MSSLENGQREKFLVIVLDLLVLAFVVSCIQVIRSNSVELTSARSALGPWKYHCIASRVYEQSNNEKKAETYTWAQLGDIIIWRYFFFMAMYHLGFIAALSIYACGLHSEPLKWWTIIWAFVVGYVAFIGITAGAHRLWTHRTYKAKLPLRISLMILYTILGLNPLYYWIRDHRVHHKYSETDADPHNAKRGFFFAHFGWLVMKRHPECLRRGKEIDMSDIEADQVVMFQKRYAAALRLLLCFAIPTAVPILLWKETVLHAVLTQCFIRYVMYMNFVLCVNSVAHLWGSRPYNRLINPAENAIVSLVSMGEGSHNYHHTFPWDYKASELPYWNFNTTTLFIDTMAKLGWAYDLREPSSELVEKVIRRIGYKSQVERVH